MYKSIFEKVYESTAKIPKMDKVKSYLKKVGIQIENIKAVGERVGNGRILGYKLTVTPKVEVSLGNEVGVQLVEIWDALDFKVNKNGKDFEIYFEE